VGSALQKSDPSIETLANFFICIRSFYPLGMHEDFGRKPCGKPTNYQPYSNSVGK